MLSLTANGTPYRVSQQYSGLLKYQFAIESARSMQFQSMHDHHFNFCHIANQILKMDLPVLICCFPVLDGP